MTGTANRTPAALIVVLALPWPGCPLESSGEESAARLALQVRTATELRSEARCGRVVPRQAGVDLFWTPAGTPAQQQRVEYASRADAFEVGDYSSSPELPPDQSTWSLERLDAERDFFWRVATRYATDWVPSEAAQFRSPLCAGDIRFILPDDPALAASALQAAGKCDDDNPRVAVAVLSWKVAEVQGEQRVSMAILPTGFETGQFDVSPPLEPDQSSFEWKPLGGLATHYWRVLTRDPDGWIASDTMTVQGPPCIADIIR